MMSASRPSALSVALSGVALWMSVGALLVWLTGGEGPYAWTRAMVVLSGLAAYMLLLVHVLLDIQTPLPVKVAPVGPHRRAAVLGPMALILVAAVVTRTAWPGSALLLFGLAPLAVLVLPGLGLSIALLKRRSLIEQLLQAAPLSIGGLLVVVLWLDLLGVRNSLEVMAVCGLTLTGLGFLSGWRDRRDAV